jgi:hypothetical protein
MQKNIIGSKVEPYSLSFFIGVRIMTTNHSYAHKSQLYLL